MTEGEILFKGQNLFDLEPEERAHLGIFMSFQYPVEIPGVSNLNFCAQLKCKSKSARRDRRCLNRSSKGSSKRKWMRCQIKPEFKSAASMKVSPAAKKNAMRFADGSPQPNFAILDETDSGLDIDAMRIVAHGVNSSMNPNMGLSSSPTISAFSITSNPLLST